MSTSMLASNPFTFQAIRFDGVSAASLNVSVTIGLAEWVLISASGSEIAKYSNAEVTWEPPVGRAPVIINFSDGTRLEASFSEELVAALSRSIPNPLALVHQFEIKPSWGIGAALGAVVCAILIYLYAIPGIAKIAHTRIPYSWKQIVGTHVISFLDEHMLLPSKLSYERQSEITDWVKELAHEAMLPSTPKVLLRHLTGLSKDSEEVSTGSANAFAVLPETIIITDALTHKLTITEIEGVVAHEIGHLAHDHGTQRVLRSSILSALIVFFLGQDLGLIENISVTLLDAHYTQDQEREADLYAARLLLRIGKDPEEFANALEKIAAGDNEGELEKYLSTHPATSERARIIREYSAQNKK